MSVVATAPTSPWKGLAPFEDNDLDALLFFGREREQEVIASNLIASRLTVLYGPSGVGKSSVLRAGVAYRLRAAAQRSIDELGHPDLAVVVFDDWRGDPVHDLREAVREALGRLFGPYAVPEVEPDASLAATFAAWTLGLDCELLLILDQVEEYFVYHPDEEADEPFADQLPELVTTRGIRVNALVSLREDALAKLDRFKARIPNIFSNYLRLDRLRPTAARSAVLGPLARYNELVGPAERVEIEPGLVDAVVEQTTVGRVRLHEDGPETTNGSDAEGVETAYLQLVLARLWDEERRRGSSRLRLGTLHELGGAGDVVRGHVRRALDSLDPGERDIAATIFNYLITPSGTKVAHSLADLEKYSEGRSDDVDAVVDVLSRERVLRSAAAPGDRGAEERGYEIYHDVLADPLLTWRRSYEEEHARERAARRQRILLAVVGLSLAALALMAGVTAYALSQRSEARSQARVALGRELTANAFAQVDTDPQLSMALAVEAAERDETPEIADVVRRALLEARSRRVLRPRPAVVLRDARRRARVVIGRRARVALLFDGERPPVAFDLRDGRRIGVLPHPSPVTAAAFGPYPNLVVTGSADGTARVWNLQTRTTEQFVRQAAPVTAVAFASKGARLATGGTDGSINLWYWPEAVRIDSLALGARVETVSFDRSGSRVLAVAGGGAYAFDLPSRRLVRLAPSLAVRSATFSPTGRSIIAVGVDGAVRMWDVGGAPIVPRLVQDGGVRAAVLSPGEKLLATATDDGTIRMLEVGGRAPPQVIVGRSLPVRALAFSGDGKSLASAAGNIARVTTIAGKPVAVLRAPGSRPIVGAALSHDGRRAVTATADGVVRIWDASVGEVVKPLHRFDSFATVALDRLGRTAAAVSESGRVAAWRLPNGEPYRHSSAWDGARAIALSRDGSRLVAARRDGALIVTELRSRRTTAFASGLGRVVAVAFAPNESTIVTVSQRGVVRIWPRPGTGGIPLRPTAAGRLAGDVRFSADHTRVAAATARRVLVWDIRRRRLAVSLRARGVVSLDLSSDGTRIATGSEDGSVRVLDVKSGKPLGALDAGTEVVALRFDPSGRRLLLATADGSARVWTFASGLQRPLHGARGRLRAPAFSSDGRWVMTAAAEGATLWDSRTGGLVTNVDPYRRPLRDAAFVPNSSLVLTASEDGTVGIYRCSICAPLGSLISAAQATLHDNGRRLTKAERRRYLHER